MEKVVLFLILFTIGVVLGTGLGLLLISFLSPFIGQKKQVELHIKGYHFHDSLYGVIPIILAIFQKGNISVFLLGLGIGLILQHLLRDRFCFITRD